MFENKKLLNDIFIEDGKGYKYLIFNNGGKTWVFPLKKLRAALEMYQPTTSKGKALKQSLLLAKVNPFALKKIGTEVRTFSINEKLQAYLAEKIQKNNAVFYIAGYMGDTNYKQNNKVTLQVYNDEEIIFYAKITKDEEVSKQFRHEIAALQFLEEKEIKGVPKVLAAENIDDLGIFIQSTDKQMYEKVRFDFDERHIKFIDEIIKAMNIKCKYEETEFYEKIQYLKTRVKREYPNQEKKIVSKAIETIEKELRSQSRKYAFSHGDFTMWNVYYTDERINVFDFEYCNYIMPCYIDVFHFMTQMSLYGSNNDADKTIEIYEKNRELLEKYIDNPDLTYACYLLTILSFYNDRTKGRFSLNDHKYKEWTEILSYLNELLNKV